MKLRTFYLQAEKYRSRASALRGGRRMIVVVGATVLLMCAGSILAQVLSLLGADVVAQTWRVP